MIPAEYDPDRVRTRPRSSLANHDPDCMRTRPHTSSAECDPGRARTLPYTNSAAHEPGRVPSRPSVIPTAHEIVRVRSRPGPSSSAHCPGRVRTRPRTLFDFARDHGRKPRMPFDVSAHGSDRVRHDNVGSHPIRHFNPVRHRATSCRTRSDVTFCGTVSGSIRCHLMPDRIGSDRTSLDLRSNP